MRASLALVLAVSISLCGCFGGDEPKQEPRAEAEGQVDREQAERAEALHGVSREDRAAFYQVATAAGGVRARAALLTLGTRPEPRSTASLEATAARLRRLHPDGSALVRLRDEGARLVRAALAAPTSGPAARRAGRRLLRAVDRLSRGLDRLLRRDPRFSALVPD